MNFNYSYRAFLITSLLFAILFLGMYTIKLSRYTEVVEEEFDVEYTLEDLEVEEEIIPSDIEQIQIETNRAYNEAEKYISQVEDERDEPSETTEEKLQAMNEAIDNSKNFDNDAQLREANEKIKESRETLIKTQKTKSKKTKSINRRTTITYSLVDRKALLIPNPVYICNGSGKVVISIEVNNLGKVVNTDYNKAASSTTNQCLIDSALEYALKARFTTNGANILQKGTISYNFPGQQ